MNDYGEMVSEWVRVVEAGRKLPLGGFARRDRPHLAADAPTVLVFSPHPDDEVIIGGFALRLMREAGWRVVNVAVTQGSRKDRQAGRLQELRDCCDCIGFECIQTAPSGLEGVNAKTRAGDGVGWGRSVDVVARLLTEHRPRAILFPHELDWNSTHVGTHWLVMDALGRQPEAFSCATVETEFWGQMASPNLMVELSEAHVADLMTALTFHVEEVRRNPYHLSLPAWMMDNVRRGAELVGGQGGGAPEFPFATLYRLRRWARGRLEPVHAGGRILGLEENAAAVLG